MKAGPICWLAIRLSRNSKFWAFAGVQGANEAAAFIRRISGVKSRAELDPDQLARDRFHELVRKPFLAWLYSGESQKLMGGERNDTGRIGRVASAGMGGVVGSYEQRSLSSDGRRGHSGTGCGEARSARPEAPLRTGLGTDIEGISAGCNGVRDRRGSGSERNSDIAYTAVELGRVAAPRGRR